MKLSIFLTILCLGLTSSNAFGTRHAFHAVNSSCGIDKTTERLIEEGLARARAEEELRKSKIAEEAIKKAQSDPYINNWIDFGYLSASAYVVAEAKENKELFKLLAMRQAQDKRLMREFRQSPVLALVD